MAVSARSDYIRLVISPERPETEGIDWIVEVTLPNGLGKQMGWFWKSIKASTTAPVVILVMLTTHIQLCGQTGRATQLADINTSSSASKTERRTPQSGTETSCIVSGSNSTSVTRGPAKPRLQHYVDLFWKASSSQSVAKYNVHRCSRDGSCSIIKTVNGTAYSDTQVQALQAFCYFITALDSKGPESGPSNVVQVVIPSP